MLGAINTTVYEANFPLAIDVEKAGNNDLFPWLENGSGAEGESVADIVEINNGNNSEDAGDDKIEERTREASEGSGNTTDKSGESKNPGELSEEEKKEVEELKEIDRKVRQHEMAHLAAAQGIAISGANFEYKRGPDGVNYAVGGDVKIDVSKEEDPEKTIEKAQRIVAAAMAPADPSPQDRSVAAKARQMEAQARAELARTQQTEAGDKQDSQVQSGASNPSQENNTSGIDSTNHNITHPGIHTYKQNQAFAPAANYPSPINNNIQSDNIISMNSNRLDLVA